jgi:hypothetical protein
MGSRAACSGIALTESDAATVKGMLVRGDRQHDIAAWFGVNGGRIAEIATGKRFGWVQAAPSSELAPEGPYPCGREASAALEALALAKTAMAAAETLVRAYTKSAV